MWIGRYFSLFCVSLGLSLGSGSLSGATIEDAELELYKSEVDVALFMLCGARYGSFDKDDALDWASDILCILSDQLQVQCDNQIYNKHPADEVRDVED